MGVADLDSDELGVLARESKVVIERVRRWLDPDDVCMEGDAERVGAEETGNVVCRVVSGRRSDISWGEIDCILVLAVPNVSDRSFCLLASIRGLSNLKKTMAYCV